MKSKDSVFHIIFGIMLMFFIVIVVCLAAKCDVESLADTEYSRTAPFIEDGSGRHTRMRGAA